MNSKAPYEMFSVDIDLAIEMLKEEYDIATLLYFELA